MNKKFRIEKNSVHISMDSIKTSIEVVVVARIKANNAAMSLSLSLPGRLESHLPSSRIRNIQHKLIVFVFTEYNCLY